MKKRKFLILLIIASSLFRLDPAALTANSEVTVSVLFSESTGTATCKVTVEQALRPLFDTDEPPVVPAYRAWASECSLDIKVEFDHPLSEKDGGTLQCCSVLHALICDSTFSSYFILEPGAFTATKTVGDGDAEITLNFYKLIEYPDDKNPDGTYVYACGGTTVEYSIWLIEPDGDHVIREYTSNGGGINTVRPDS